MIETAIELLRAACRKDTRAVHQIATTIADITRPERPGQLDPGRAEDGARGPEVYQPNDLRLTDEQASALFAQMNTERKNWTPDKEAQAQRIADAANAWAARLEAKESNPSAMTPDELNECRLDTEDAIEEARR